jgi:hypothetical protein
VVTEAEIAQEECVLMLSRTMVSVTIGVLLSTAIPQGARAAPAVATRPVIHIEDVARFYKLYDATDGHPTAAELQDYIDHGSEGLRYFAKARNTTGARIAAAIAEHSPMYADAGRCMAVLPRVRVRVTAALHKLKELYPEAKLLTVTIVVGRAKPVAIGDSREGVEVGLESLCAVNWMNPNVEDRFVPTLAVLSKGPARKIGLLFVHGYQGDLCLGDEQWSRPTAAGHDQPLSGSRCSVATRHKSVSGRNSLSTNALGTPGTPAPLLR